MSKIHDWLLFLTVSAISIYNLVCAGATISTGPEGGPIIHLTIGLVFFLMSMITMWTIGINKGVGIPINTDATSRKFLLNRNWDVIVGSGTVNGLGFAVVRDGWFVRTIYLGNGDATSSGKWIFLKVGEKIHGCLAGTK